MAPCSAKCASPSGSRLLRDIHRVDCAVDRNSETACASRLPSHTPAMPYLRGTIPSWRPCRGRSRTARSSRIRAWDTRVHFLLPFYDAVQPVKYTFGTIRLDPESRDIAKDGRAVHLTRKAFDLLLLLLEARPSAVTKDQIHARIWPDAFVSESSLQTLVHEIRLAIDDPGADESWIRTMHGIGYRFCGDVLIDGSSHPRQLERVTAWLVGESMRVGLRPGENILGRGLEGVTDVDLPTISRRHARIEVTEDRLTVEDLGSKNGTWLNDERVSDSRALTDGDVLHLGSARFRVRVCRSADATETIDPPQ
jgi:DNA-binding winged helix-turn-helix (wHTH) protein